MALSETVPLGLPALDKLIKGGVPRPGGYMVTGESLSGKTVFGMQIQYAALERGEPCVFVTFRQPFWRILHYYESFMCWDVKPFIKDGRLSITDCFTPFFETSPEEREFFLQEWENRGYERIRDAVHFIDDPEDPDVFIGTHVAIFERTGPGGATIIDSLSDQLRFAKDPEKIIEIHERARHTFASSKYLGTGFHLYAPDQIETARSSHFSAILDGFEDGKIELRRVIEEDGSERRYVRVAGIRKWCGSTRWQEFSISSEQGITIIDADVGVDEQETRTQQQSGASKLAGIVERARIEVPRYEFKQGFLRLDGTRTRDTALMDRIINTMCGMANIGPETDGHIYIGLADTESDAQRISEIDGISPLGFGGHFLVGIDREAKALDMSLAEYIEMFVDHVRNSTLSAHTMQSVLSSIHPVFCEDFCLLEIHVPRQHKPSYVGELCFIRQGASTRKIKGPGIENVVKRFHRRH